jgi:hypothetical protein
VLKKDNRNVTIAPGLKGLVYTPPQADQSPVNGAESQSCLAGGMFPKAHLSRCHASVRKSMSGLFLCRAVSLPCAAAGAAIVPVQNSHGLVNTVRGMISG